MNKVYAVIYGCSANRGDYEIGLGLLKQNGFLIINMPEQADVNIIFTCAVKEATVNRMFHKVKELTKLGKPLIIAGCLPKVEDERKIVEKIDPLANFIGPDAVTKIVDVARATLNREKVSRLERVYKEKVDLPHMRTNQIIDIIEISSGCSSNCSFCATKLARGNLYSYRPHSIREQIKQAVAEGCKEVWLTSQDSGAYGKDIGTNLIELLESITKIKGGFFVRVGMMNPLHFRKVEIESLANIYVNEKIFKFLHLCAQSGSNKVLEVMRRGYTVEQFVYYVEQFRKEIPELTLSTDIIVGHPGEKKRDFEQTIKLVKKIKPDIVNLSKFGSRPGTSAAKMKRLDPKTVSKRSIKLTKLIHKISLKNNAKWVGWKGSVLIDEIGQKGKMIGRNYAYKPIVLEGKLGSIKKTEIVEAQPTFLIGK